MTLLLSPWVTPRCPRAKVLYLLEPLWNKNLEKKGHYLVWIDSLKTPAVNMLSFWWYYHRQNVLCQFHLSITLSIRVKLADFISHTLFSVIKWKFKSLLSSEWHLYRAANGKVSRLYLVSVHFCSISLSWSNISLFRRVLMGVSGSSGLSFLFPSHYQPYACFKFLPVNSQRAGLNFNWFLSRRKNFSTEWKHFQHKMGCLNAHINLFWKARIYAKTDCLPDSVPVLCV